MSFLQSFFILCLTAATHQVLLQEGVWESDGCSCTCELHCLRWKFNICNCFTVV